MSSFFSRVSHVSLRRGKTNERKWSRVSVKARFNLGEHPLIFSCHRGHAGRNKRSNNGPLLTVHVRAAVRRRAEAATDTAAQARSTPTSAQLFASNLLFALLATFDLGWPTFSVALIFKATVSTISSLLIDSSPLFFYVHSHIWSPFYHLIILLASANCLIVGLLYFASSSGKSENLRQSLLPFHPHLCGC